MSAHISIDEAIRFLWLEADMLDRRDYDAWLDLWTENGLYVVPVDRDADEHADVLNFAYDDSKMRRMRVERLKSRFSMSAVSASLTVRTVSRFVLLEQETDLIVLRAAQHLADYRRDRLQMVAADLTASIRLTEGGFRLERKVVRLVNSTDAISGFAYLL